MSLISIQNFMAPFRSKTHLVTLIIVAAVFGAFRLSGGSISSVPRMQRKMPATYSAPSTDAMNRLGESADGKPQQRTARPTTQQYPPSRDSILDTINTPDASSQGSSKAKEDLSDIERKLGLR
jgi:hypothetical protein